MTLFNSEVIIQKSRLERLEIIPALFSFVSRLYGVVTDDRGALDCQREETPEDPYEKKEEELRKLTGTATPSASQPSSLIQTPLGPYVGSSGALADDGALASAAVTTKSAFSHTYNYDKRVFMRAIEEPVSHNFPFSIDDEVLATNPSSRPSGYKIFQLPGKMNGKIGRFERGVNKYGVIDHRFFRPGR